MRPANIQIHPATLPGHCFKCRTSPPRREYFFDLGIDTDYEGVIYICNMCMEEIISISNDFATKKKLDFILEHVNKTYELAEKKEEKFNKLVQILDELGIDAERLLQNGRVDTSSDFDTVSDSGSPNEYEQPTISPIGEPSGLLFDRIEFE